MPGLFSSSLRMPGWQWHLSMGVQHQPAVGPGRPIKAGALGAVWGGAEVDWRTQKVALKKAPVSKTCVLLVDLPCRSAHSLYVHLGNNKLLLSRWRQAVFTLQHRRSKSEAIHSTGAAV